MIKRKKEVKAITTMVIVLIMFIISAVPAFAASYLNEVNVLDDFVIRVENPTNTAYRVNLNIEYQDENGNTLCKKNVHEDVEAFETITLDAKDYYNSEKTQKVVVEINDEKTIKTIKSCYCSIIGAAIFFVLFINLVIVNVLLKSDVVYICSLICLIITIIAILLSLIIIQMA